MANKGSKSVRCSLIAWDSAASDVAWDTSCWLLNIVAEEPVELTFAVW